MKTPSFASSIALLFLAGGLAQAASAQAESTPSTPTAAQPSKPAEPAAPPAADKSARKSDAGGGSAPVVSRLDDFARADTDRDGKISVQEYAASEFAAIAMIAEGKRQGSETQHGGFSFDRNEGRPDQSKLFHRQDTDGDGYLSRAELERGKTHR
jgi:glucose/arabinose dehydrogenase